MKKQKLPKEFYCAEKFRSFYDSNVESLSHILSLRKGCDRNRCKFKKDCEIVQSHALKEGKFLQRLLGFLFLTIFMPLKK